MGEVITAKRQAFKAWKTGKGTRASYHAAKRIAWDPNHLSDESPVEGPPIPITIDMVKKAISQMKAGKASGPSGIVVEMIRAASDMGASMIHDLAAAIIRDGKVPSD